LLNFIERKERHGIRDILKAEFLKKEGRKYGATTWALGIYSIYFNFEIDLWTRRICRL
jgi:hypothetical protein